ncbi:MAG: hypothetical protein ACLQFT_19980, partial [Steroidobacteraceae bacterium]
VQDRSTAEAKAGSGRRDGIVWTPLSRWRMGLGNMVWLANLVRNVEKLLSSPIPQFAFEILK